MQRSSYYSINFWIMQWTMHVSEHDSIELWRLKHSFQDGSKFSSDIADCYSNMQDVTVQIMVDIWSMPTTEMEYIPDDCYED